LKPELFQNNVNAHFQPFLLKLNFGRFRASSPLSVGQKCRNCYLVDTSEIKSMQEFFRLMISKQTEYFVETIVITQKDTVAASVRTETRKSQNQFGTFWTRF
jgi:hypothetical protein